MTTEDQPEKTNLWKRKDDGMIYFPIMVDHLKRIAGYFKNTGRHVPSSYGKKTSEMVVFFRPVFPEGTHWLNHDQIEQEYISRGLKPADLFQMAAVDEADPSFLDTHICVTQWKDESGKWHAAAFGTYNKRSGLQILSANPILSPSRWLAGTPIQGK